MHCCRTGQPPAPGPPSPDTAAAMSSHRGDLASLDRQIETLMNREKLPEAEVKALCEKARARTSALGALARACARPGAVPFAAPLIVPRPPRLRAG